MADKERPSVDAFDLLALPSPAVEAVARAVKPKGSLLRTSSACRDAVLATCKVAQLGIDFTENEEHLRRHQPLLARVCSTAPRGLRLNLHGQIWNSQPTPRLSRLLDGLNTLPAVHHLELQKWVLPSSGGSGSFSLPQMFPNLHRLLLFGCSIQGADFFPSLQHCTQLTALAVGRCQMSSDAASAVSSLHVLTGLQQLRWDLPGGSYTHSDARFKALAQLTQLTSLSLSYFHYADDKPAVSTLMTVPSEVRTLQAFEMAPAVWAGRDVRAKSFGTINLDFTDRPVWDRLDSADLQQLLTRHTTLTTLALNSVVLDQAGLDLLLAHPHVVHVTLLAIAATESRVDSPCSWQTLQLAWQVDIRTLAYVPLHSLKQPLAVGSLLLPPDVRTEQLPGLLHQVTEKLAAEWQQVALRVPGWLVIEDHIKPLRGLAPGVFTRNWTPDHCTALLTSLAPLASPAFGNITGIGFHFLDKDYDDHVFHNSEGAAVIGAAELSALGSAWGDRLTHLYLSGVSLHKTFFSAVLQHLPGLQVLSLNDVSSKALRARLHAFCSQVPRPLKLELFYDLLSECKEFVLELERMGAPPLLVQLSIFDRWALQPWQAVAAHTLAPAGR